MMKVFVIWRHHLIFYPTWRSVKAKVHMNQVITYKKRLFWRENTFFSTMTNSFMVKRRNKYFIHHMHCMCIFFSSFILLLIFTLMSSLDLCKNIWGNVWWLQNWFTFKWGALLLFSKHFMSRWKSNEKGYM